MRDGAASPETGLAPSHKPDWRRRLRSCITKHVPRTSKGLVFVVPLRIASGHDIAERGNGMTDGYASIVSQVRDGVAFMAASQEPVRPLSLLRTTDSQMDTIGYRRFSGALMSQGPGTIHEDRLVALILMGDWCVPAGHDSQANEDRGACQEP